MGMKRTTMGCFSYITKSNTVGLLVSEDTIFKRTFISISVNKLPPGWGMIIIII
jgi:hypothetical protein